MAENEKNAPLLKSLRDTQIQQFEYFIKIKGTPIKSAGRTTANEYQLVVEAISAQAALDTLGKQYDIQELIAINKL